MASRYKPGDLETILSWKVFLSSACLSDIPSDPHDDDVTAGPAGVGGCRGGQGDVHEVGEAQGLGELLGRGEHQAADSQHEESCCKVSARRHSRAPPSALQSRQQAGEEHGQNGRPDRGRHGGDGGLHEVLQVHSEDGHDESWRL